MSPILPSLKQKTHRKPPIEETHHLKHPKSKPLSPLAPTTTIKPPHTPTPTSTSPHNAKNSHIPSHTLSPGPTITTPPASTQPPTNIYLPTQAYQPKKKESTHHASAPVCPRYRRSEPPFFGRHHSS